MYHTITHTHSLLLLSSAVIAFILSTCENYLKMNWKAYSFHCAIRFHTLHMSTRLQFYIVQCTCSTLHITYKSHQYIFSNASHFVCNANVCCVCWSTLNCLSVLWYREISWISVIFFLSILLCKKTFELLFHLIVLLHICNNCCDFFLECVCVCVNNFVCIFWLI